MFIQIYNADGEPIGMHIKDTSTWGWLVSEIAKKLDGRAPYMIYSTYRGLCKRFQARPDELVYDVLTDDEMTRGIQIMNAPDPEAYERASEAVREAEAALETAKRRQEEERRRMTTVFK